MWIMEIFGPPADTGRKVRRLAPLQFFSRVFSCTAAQLLLALGLAFAAAGWVRPALPTRSQATHTYNQKLDYLVVTVNSESHIVADGDELAVVRGDQVTVKSCALRDHLTKAREVNVVGLPGHGGQDLGRSFDTARLEQRYSEDGKGEVYAILAESRNVLHGRVYLRLVTPVLRYAEVEINGKKQVVRDGEPLTVKATDQIKVARVVTNVAKEDGVLFQIVDAPDGNGTYEIRFVRSDQVFARIPLKVYR